jgi:hypothetical protein
VRRARRRWPVVGAHRSPARLQSLSHGRSLPCAGAGTAPAARIMRGCSVGTQMLMRTTTNDTTEQRRHFGQYSHQPMRGLTRSRQARAQGRPSRRLAPGGPRPAAAVVNRSCHVVPRIGVADRRTARGHPAIAATSRRWPPRVAQIRAAARRRPIPTRLGPGPAASTRVWILDLRANMRDRRPRRALISTGDVGHPAFTLSIHPTCLEAAPLRASAKRWSFANRSRAGRTCARRGELGKCRIATRGRDDEDSPHRQLRLLHV